MNRHKEPRGPSGLGDIFYEYETVKNPVTKSVLRQIIQDRLNRFEAWNKRIRETDEMF